MRLYVFDIDGTVLPEGELHLREKTIVILDSLLAHGDAICFASGRPYLGVKQHLDALANGKKYIIAGNGAALYTYEGKLLYEAYMTVEDFYDLHARYGHPGTTVYSYDDQNGLGIFNHDKWIDFEQACNKIQRLVDYSDPRQIDFHNKIYKVMLAGDPADSRQVKIEASDLANFNVMRSAPTFIEILPKKGEKAIGTAHLSQILHIPAKDVFTFGDGGNDVRMLKEFQGVAMGNAVVECKAVSRYVTKTCREDGVAYAITELLPKDE